MKRTNPYPDLCQVIDITQKDDFTSETGYDKVAKILETTPNVAILVSFPCTGGCLFNAGINAANPKCTTKLRCHWQLFRKLWKNLVRLCDSYPSDRINLIIEWPRYCTYWQQHRVQRFMKKMNLFFSDFDGCQYDLQPTGGSQCDFLKKPWRFATNIPNILPHFNRKCTGVDEHHQHQPTRGKNAVNSQYYTPTMTRQIHYCIRMFFENNDGNTTPR